ncbi:MAG: hypothetical protein ACI35O_16730 [Bacillaceae bacterium]
MSIKELAVELSKIHKELNFHPKKIKIDEKGNILLDWNDKNDREWYENDDEYDGLINIKEC